MASTDENLLTEVPGALDINEISPDFPLRQGDVIVSHLTNDDVLKRAGVVVTADCHLARQKHRGHLNFVPLLPSRTYLAVTWIDDQLQERRQLAEKELHRHLSEAHSGLLGRPSTLTLSRASEWTREASADEIAHELGISAEDQIRPRLTLLIDLISSVNRLSYADFEASRSVLFRLCEAELGKNFANVSDRLSDRLKQLPEDAFFLNGGCELSSPYGYVCYLRLMQTVDEQDIELRRPPLFSDRVKQPYRRVGRLGSPFVYALTQALGNIYSTIGLPTSYEDSRDQSAKSIRTWLSDLEES